MRQVELGDLLVEDLWKNVDTDWELLGLAELDVLLSESSILALEQHDLGKDLVGERAGHHEGGVSGGTTEVDKATLSEEDDVAAVLHEEAVHLWLDVLDGGSVGLQPRDVNLDIEVTDVANDGIVRHGLEVLADEDVTASGGGDEDLSLGSSLLHWHNLEAGNGSLESVDWVNLGNDDTGTHGVESHGASLSDITETGDDSDLTSDHDIGGTLDTIDKGLAAAVKVVEFGLGDGVVDVDGWDKELSFLEHLVEVVNTSGGLLGDTVAVLEHLRVLLVDKSGQTEDLLAIDPRVVKIGVTYSPPSSRMRLRDLLSLKATNCCSKHHSYSSSVSPFQAKTGTPAAAIAAAAWSWVEKMLQEDQVTSAPR